MDRMAQHQAVMLATNDYFLLSAGIFAVLALIVWFSKTPQQVAAAQALAGH